MLVNSYTPLLARRLAADLTVRGRILEIFQKYGFTPTNSNDQGRLIGILSGDALREKINLEAFKDWPCAAVGGSFAQELATALDYMPSTWALARELAKGVGGGVGGRVSNGAISSSPKDEAWGAGLMGLAFSGGRYSQRSTAHGLTIAFVTESQFESYRRLGLHIAETTFKRAVNDQQNQVGSPYKLRLFEELRDNWYPPVAAIQNNFTRHAQALDNLVREMRADNTLVELDTLLIPVAGAAPPHITANEEPKVFLFLSSVIQLMENIYLDLDLEANADHPHCAGWIQIFQSWAETDLFRRAWDRYAWTYGRNFRRFCYRRFGLPSAL